MSTINSVCYHEPTSQLHSFEELVEFWRPKYGERVGIADSALTLQLDRILSEIGPRTLLIKRSIPDVMASLKNYLRDSNMIFDYDAGRAYLGQIQDKIDSLDAHPLVKVVDFEDLRDYQTTHDLIHWLAPGIDLLDLKSLMTMNIQADRDYVIGLASKPHSHWYRKQWNTSAKSATA